MKKLARPPARTHVSLAAAALLMAAAGAAFATALWDAPPGGDPVPPTSATSTAEQKRIAAATQAAATRRAATLIRLKESAPAFMERTGTILPLPADTPDALRGKTVSLALDKVSTASALRSLSTASGFSIKPATPYVLTSADLPNITLHVKDVPFMEALLELCSQAGLRITAITDKQVTVARNESGVGIGRWCVSGPAAVILEGLSHRVSLREGGQGAPGDGNGGIGFWIGFRVFVQPDTHVFVYPQSFHWDTLTDDNGRPLAPASLTSVDLNNVRLNIFGAASTSSLESGRIVVQLPETDGLSQHIKQMKGHLDLAVATYTKTVTVNSEDLDAGTEATVSGMKVTVASLGRENGAFTTSVSFERGDMPSDAWDRLKPSFAGCAPRVIDATGAPAREYPPPHVTDNGQEVIVAQRYFANRADSKNLPVDRVEVTLPTDVQTLSVPVDFQDLLLP